MCTVLSGLRRMLRKLVTSASDRELHSFEPQTMVGLWRFPFLARTFERKVSPGTKRDDTRSTDADTGGQKVTRAYGAVVVSHSIFYRTES